MVSYRFYPIDRDGRFGGTQIFEAADDAAAHEKALALKDESGAFGFELWDRARRVGHQRTD